MAPPVAMVRQVLAWPRLMPQMFSAYSGEPGGYAVVAHEPQADGHQQEGQALLHIRREGVALGGVLRQVVLGVLALIFLLLFYQLRLVDKEHDNGQGRRHNACHNGEQREEADVGLALHMV